MASTAACVTAWPGPGPINVALLFFALLSLALRPLALLSLALLSLALAVNHGRLTCVLAVNHCRLTCSFPCFTMPSHTVVHAFYADTTAGRMLLRAAGLNPRSFHVDHIFPVSHAGPGVGKAYCSALLRCYFAAEKWRSIEG